MKEVHKFSLAVFLALFTAKAGGAIFRALSLSLLSLKVYGELAVFTVLLNTLGIVSAFGFPLLATKNAKNTKNFSTMFVNYTKFVVLISLSVSFTIFLFSPLLSQAFNVREGIILILSLTLPCFALYNLAVFSLRGKRKSKAQLFAEASTAFFRIVFFILLFIAGITFAPFLAFPLAFCITLLIIAWLERDFVISLKFSQKLKVSEKHKKTLLRAALLVMIAEAARFFAVGVDRLVLSSLFSSYTAGIYDAGSLLCLPILMIAASYGISLLSSKNVKEELKEAFKGYAKFFFIYGIFALTLGEYLLIAIKPSAAEILPYIPGILISYLLAGMVMILSYACISQNFYKIAAFSSLLFLACVCILNLLLTPGLKFSGCIFALTISTIFPIFILGEKLWKNLRKR